VVTSTSRRRLVATVVAAAAGLGVVPAASAEDARAAAPSTDQVVQEWYGDFLFREDPAADPDRGYWVGRLDRGDRRGDVAWSLTETREYAEVNVAFLYDYYFDRTPDRGAEGWVSGVAGRGMALEWVEQNLLASEEYWLAANSSRTELVRVWYADLLGRDASRADISYWSARTDQIGRLAAVREIWYSQEAVDRRIRGNYFDLLGRLPSPGEVGYWRPLERESDRNVQVLIAATPEYERVALSD